MEWTNLVWLLYFSITTFALIMTGREQARAGHTSLVFNVFGYLACALWPVVFPVVFLKAQQQAA